MSKFQVNIKRSAESRNAFVRALRLVGPISLRQAQDMAIHFERFHNSVLVAGVDLPVAEHLAEVLRDAGAEVAVQASSLNTPVLCMPQVNTKYRWNAFRTISKAA